MAASDHISKIQMRRFPGDHADTHPVETSDDMLVEELLYDGRKDEDDSHTVDLESPGPP